MVQPPQGLGEAHARHGLALTGSRRRHRRDENQLPIFPIAQTIERLLLHFGLEFAVGFQLIDEKSELTPDTGNWFQLGLPRDFNVRREWRNLSVWFGPAQRSEGFQELRLNGIEGFTLEAIVDGLELGSEPGNLIGHPFFVLDRFGEEGREFFEIVLFHAKASHLRNAKPHPRTGGKALITRDCLIVNDDVVVFQNSGDLAALLSSRRGQSPGGSR